MCSGFFLLGVQLPRIRTLWWTGLFLNQSQCEMGIGINLPFVKHSIK